MDMIKWSSARGRKKTVQMLEKVAEKWTALKALSIWEGFFFCGIMKL